MPATAPCDSPPPLPPLNQVPLPAVGPLSAFPLLPLPTSAVVPLLSPPPLLLLLLSEKDGGAVNTIANGLLMSLPSARTVKYVGTPPRNVCRVCQAG